MDFVIFEYIDYVQKVLPNKFNCRQFVEKYNWLQVLWFWPSTMVEPETLAEPDQWVVCQIQDNYWMVFPDDLEDPGWC